MKQHILMAVLLLPLHLLGQSAPKNALSLQYGLGHIARQDLVFSPFIYKGISPLCAGLTYTRRAKIHQEASLGFASFQAGVTDPYTYQEDGKNVEAFPHAFTLIDLHYRVGKPLGKTLVAGIQFHSGIQSLNYSYGRVSSSFGYFAQFRLGIYLEKHHSFGKRSSVSGKLGLPLLQWLARSPYLVNDDEFIENTSSHSGLKTFFAFVEDGHFAFMDTYQAADVQLGYRYDLNDRWALGATYSFAFQHARHPRALLQYRNTLQCSATLHF